MGVPVIGSICLGPGREKTSKMHKLIHDLKMPACETILYRDDVSDERADEITEFLNEAHSLGISVMPERDRHNKRRAHR